MESIGSSTASETVTEDQSEVTEPKMYRVFILNDHYTTRDFVVSVLMTIFQKKHAEATKLMLDVHKKGSGLCGVYLYDIAISKINKVHTLAKKNNFPLKCICEPV